MSEPSRHHAIQASLKRATDLFRAGQYQQALKLLQELGQQHPDQPEVLRALGIGLVQAGQPQAAEGHLRRALELQPGSAMAASDLAGVLLSLSRFTEALDILQSARASLETCAVQDISPRDRATFHFNLGRACKQTGQTADAEQPLRKTLELVPRHYAALIVLGDVCKALGKADEAAACYRQAIDVNPADGTGWWSLSNLKAGSFSDTEIEALQHEYGRQGRTPRQQALFEFALASALDQRDDIGRAFAHYQAGNRLASQREPWDRGQFRGWLQALQQAAQDSDHLRNLLKRPMDWSGPRPIFIISLPRSGSTLVEQVLAAHSQVTAASELPWIPQLIAAEAAQQSSGLVSWIGQMDASGWSRLGQEYLSHCRLWTRETAVFTDKLPGNLPYIGAILSMLPDALVVGVRRDAMDVCWSCYRQLLMGGSEFIYDLQDLADYWHDFESHMDFWEQFAPERVMSVQYEDLVREPEAQTRRLLEFAGLEFEPACLSPQKASRAVNTASAMQVREPIHARGVGHWQRYARHLGELQAALRQQP
jgi:Flp pilus assembly protein TadD